MMTVENLKEKYPNIYYYLNDSFSSEELKDILSNLDEDEYSFVEEKLEYDGCYYISDFFKKSYRDFYGSKAIMDNFHNLSVDSLDYGLSNPRAGELIKFLLGNNISLRECSCDFIESSKVDREFVEKISPLFCDIHVKDFILKHFKIENDSDKEFLENALNPNSFENSILKTMVYKYGEFEQGKCKSFLELDSKENLYKFVKLMPDEYFNDNSKMNRFIKLYKKCKNIIDDVCVDDVFDEKVKQCFKTYILDINKDEFSVQDKSDLLNIYKIRDKFYLDKINNTENIGKIKSYISQNYFGMRFKKFYNKMNEISNIIRNKETSDEFSMDEFFTFSSIDELVFCKTKNQLLNYYERLKYSWDGDIYTYIDDLDKKIKDIYQRNLVKDLTRLPKGFQVINYEGESFEFLVHKVIGMENKKYAEKIILNPEFWKENTKEFIDVSYISEDHFGMADGYGLTFIFNNVKASEIAAMGTYDIYTNYNNVCGGVTNLKEEWMLKDDLVKNKTHIFDNHVIKKEDGRPAGAFTPDGILCFSEISDRDVIAAKVFDVPIVVIDREKYLEKLNDKVVDAFMKKDYSVYYIKKLQMFLSAYEDKRLVRKYFSSEVLDKEVMDYMDNIDINSIRDLRMLSTMFKVNKKINRALANYSGIDYYESDMKSVVKKLKKKYNK